MSDTTDPASSLTDALSSIASSAVSTALSASATLTGTGTGAGTATDSLSPSNTGEAAGAAPTQTGANQAGSGQKDEGIGIVSFLTAVGVAVIVFSIQILFFLILRNKLARILYVEASPPENHRY